MEHANRSRLNSAILAATAALVALFVIGWDAATQLLPPNGALVTAQPPANAILADAPDLIALTFSSEIDAETSSIRLLGEAGIEIPLEQAPTTGNPNQIAARPAGILGGGDYMVVWSAQAVDGTLLAGAYPFRAGGIENPGAAQLEWQWPLPLAAFLRSLVFLGTALSLGGFAWSRLLAARAGGRPTGSLLRGGAMTGGALIALLATLLPPLLQSLLFQSSEQAFTLTASLRGMPLGWWVQLIALAALVLLCLGTLTSGRMPAAAAARLDWVGLAVGLASLTGLSFTSHAAASRDGLTLALEVVHQWSAALWFSGLLYLIVGWRALGSDIARFRTVRWLGGVLIAISILSGFAVASQFSLSLTATLSTLYGRVLGAKSAFVLVILALGLLSLIVPRRASARRASSSLAAQGLLGFIVTLFAAVLALMATPGTGTPAISAGIDLVDTVTLDSNTFGAANGLVHLLTQPGRTRPQTVVVRLTDENGTPLVPSSPPDVQVLWTPLTNSESGEIPTRLQPDPASVAFTGTAALAMSQWWRADVVITPPGGIASLARFWLVLPDPNMTGHGPDPQIETTAQNLYDRALASMSRLQSVRISRRLNDGSGTLARSLVAVSANRPEQPAAFAETVIDATSAIRSQQRIVDDRRWVLSREEGWIEAESEPVVTPAALAESYAGATGFQLGPREGVDGEICQVITFWQPGQYPSRAPAWYVWWIGLASGEVRREVLISSQQYVISSFSDFNAPLDIAAPIIAKPATPAATPEQRQATPLATPTGEDQDG